MPRRVSRVLVLLPMAAFTVAVLGLLAAGMGRPPLRVEALPTERSTHVFFARASIDGAGPFWLTVDTGATHTVIDPGTAAGLGLPTREAGRHGSVGVGPDVTDLAIARGASLQVGSRTFRPDPLWVVGVKAAEPHLRHRIDGVLGMDFLERHVVEFDYAAGHVRLRAAPPAARDRALPLLVSGSVPTVVARLVLPDGRELTPRLLIDTGSSGGLSLNSPYVRRHSLDEAFPARPGASLDLRVSVGVNGVTTSRVVSFGALVLGAARLDRPDVALSSATEGLAASAAYDGILGAEVLRHFGLVMDFRAGALWTLK